MPHILRIASLSTIVLIAGAAAARTSGLQTDDPKTAQELTARYSAYVARQAAAEPSRASATDASAAESRLKTWRARAAAPAGEAARAGTMFSGSAPDLVRRRLQEVLQSSKGAAVRAELEQAASEHIRAKGYEKFVVGQPVSAPELPFALAEALPRVPHGLQYRFLGDRLILRDENTSVLVDFVSNALPPAPPKRPASAPRAPSPVALAPQPMPLPLPNVSSSVKFAVLGDTGAGKDRSTPFDGKYRAHAVAKMVGELHASFPFTFALMTGDNMYTDPDTQKAFAAEVVEPYKALRAQGIVFRAVLGNHDNPSFQLPLAELNLNNRRFYAFEAGNVRFLILHSDEYVLHGADPEQDAFIKTTLTTPFQGWTMAAFHHPLYSSGGHRNENETVREALKPLLNGGARVVFTGHEHFYERTKAKPGLAHFVSGAAAKLRVGDLHESDDTEKGFDDEHSVMLVEVDRDEMYFEAIGLSKRVRDCGVVSRTNAPLSQGAAAWAKLCTAAIGS